MKEGILRIYHQLPSPMRSWVATVRGWTLRRQRYGPETEALVKEALQRERWSTEQWEQWRRERLKVILQRAATKVPYYRNIWAGRCRDGEREMVEDLCQWPVLDKEYVRANPGAFVADDCDLRRLTSVKTSGTSGKPIVVWSSRETLRAWYALFEARCRRWFGLSRRDRWAIFGGQLVTPVTQSCPPFWVWNAALNQLYMSTFHLTSDSIEDYLEALVRYRIRHLWGYSSSLQLLAEYTIAVGRNDLKMEVVLTNAEPLTAEQRKLISRAFHCPVRETYGMAEKVAGASECEFGSLHLWPDAGFVEVLADDTDVPVPAGTVGRIVCTSLLNRDMPLIRYVVGDRGALASSSEACPCGRTLPSLLRLEGRNNDLLFTPDGRRVYWLNPVFSGMPVRESQIIQEATDRIRIKYVAVPGFSNLTKQTIEQRLQQRLGEVTVVFEEVREIPRGPNGKFRAVICNLSLDEIQGLTSRMTAPNDRNIH